MCLAGGQKLREETPDADGADTQHVRPVLCMVLSCCLLCLQTLLSFSLADPQLGAPSHSDLVEPAHDTCVPRARAVPWGMVSLQ